MRSESKFLASNFVYMKKSREIPDLLSSIKLIAKMETIYMSEECQV